MPAEPILTIGDLEPERPLVTVNRNAPDGPWQRFKHRHFDLLLRWFPVRYQWHKAVYPMRLRSEFGAAQLAKLQRYAADAKALEGAADESALIRLSEILGEFCKLILVAPADVIEGLDLEQRVALVMAFQAAVMGRTPTSRAAGNPSTSAAPSPDSAVSTAPTTG